MPVFSTIGTVFSEMLLTVLSVAAFAILVKEYAMRRFRPLLFYSLAFLAQTFAVATLFGGQVLSANGSDQTAVDTLRMSAAFTAVSGIFFAAAFMRRCKRELWWAATTVSAALVAYGIYTLAMLKPFVTQANGVTFVVYDTWQLSVIHAPLFFAVLCGMACRLSQVLKTRRKGNPPVVADRLMLKALSFGVIFGLLIILAVALRTPVLVLPSMAAYLLFLFLTFIVALTEEHPDRAVRQKPSILFRQNLVLKAVSINAVVIWALSVGMLAIIASSFVQNSLNERRVGMQRDLRHFVQTIRLRQLEQLDVVENFVDLRDVAAVLGGTQTDTSRLLSVAEESVGRLHGTRVFELVDRNGIVRFSSRATAAAAMSLADSRAVASALAGNRHVLSIEKDATFNLWVVRAAVPVFAQDGTMLGVAVVSDVDSAFNFSDYVSIAPISSSGYGFVSESEDVVFFSGSPVAQEVRTELHRRVAPMGISFYDDGENTFFFERTFNSSGTPDGYFYIVVANRVMDAEAFRIVSLVAVLMLFSVMLVTALLLFSMTVVLRPIRELRAAAAKVESDVYDHRVKYGSPDELGQLATAFNRMLDTIGERTLALKAAVRERHDFLDHATRELRTPLSIFRWTLDMMRFGDTGRLNKEQMELIERLHQTNERLTKLVQNLQDVTLIDRGLVTLKKAPLSVEDIVDTVAGQVSVEARKKGIELRWNRPKDALPKAPVDGVYVEKVLLNLVTNAVKYTQQKGYVEIKVAEEEAVRQDGRKGRFVKVTVKDNGIGIPVDDSSRIFSRFFRATNITGFEIEGTGLGLYMAKRLVELHGGRIMLESREGVGTTVAITLPTEDDDTPKNGLAIVNA